MFVLKLADFGFEPLPGLLLTNSDLMAFLSPCPPEQCSDLDAAREAAAWAIANEMEARYEHLRLHGNFPDGQPGPESYDSEVDMLSEEDEEDEYEEEEYEEEDEDTEEFVRDLSEAFEDVPLTATQQTELDLLVATAEEELVEAQLDLAVYQNELSDQRRAELEEFVREASPEEDMFIEVVESVDYLQSIFAVPSLRYTRVPQAWDIAGM